MKAVVYDWHTDIFLTGEEFKELCKPGAGEDTCIWATAGVEGIQCMYHNRPMALIDRWRAGDTIAKRDGCDRVIHFRGFTKMGEQEVP